MNEINTLLDPIGWCTDMTFCDYSGIKKVYCHEALTKMNGCEFHCNQSVQRQIKQLEEPQRSSFRDFAKQMLHATTPAGYAHTFGEMKA